ncbi:hypothetical protein BKP66_06590 [Bacillus amyloliquefaciens]|uniref:Uncharacterized protein n=1 Tax=Bacillus amyloliquefaciens TaxID=1390 RepID=A0AAP7N9U3_BACAM|nr:hypothetical protein BKP66_06590 [Bacillus amyloliquefaciens]
MTESLKNQFTYFYDHCPVFIEHENHFQLNHHIITSRFSKRNRVFNMTPFFLSCLYCKKEVKNVKEGNGYIQKRRKTDDGRTKAFAD